MQIKSTLDTPKSAKWLKNIVFGGLDFFDVFWRAKKTEKNDKSGSVGEKGGRPGGMSKPLGRIIGGF